MMMNVPPSANAAYLTNRGEILRRWGMLDEGLACCERAVELDPSSPEARNNLGLALLGKGRLADAIVQSCDPGWRRRISTWGGP